MLTLLQSEGFLALLELLTLCRLPLSDFHQLHLELGLVLFEALGDLLELDVTLGYVVLDLGECLILLLQAVLVHLVEVHVGHQSVALVTHAVLLLVNLGEAPLRRGAQGADTAAAATAVVLLLILGHNHAGYFPGERDGAELTGLGLMPVHRVNIEELGKVVLLIIQEGAHEVGLLQGC